MHSDSGSELFKKLMQKCKRVRKTQTKLTVRQLSKTLGVTEGFLTALENGRKTPSNKLLMNYLLELGIDTQLMVENLQVQEEKIQSDHDHRKLKLMKVLNEIEDPEVIASILEFTHSLIKFKKLSQGSSRR